MIRLTQPELVHDKKQQESSSLDDSTAAIKKEADAEPVTSQGTEQGSSGTKLVSLPQFWFTCRLGKICWGL